MDRGCRKGAEAQLPQWVSPEAACPRDKCSWSPAVEPSVPTPDPGLIPRVLLHPMFSETSVPHAHVSSPHSVTQIPVSRNHWCYDVGTQSGGAGMAKAVILAEGFPKDTEPQKGGD